MAAAHIDILLDALTVALQDRAVAPVEPDKVLTVDEAAKSLNVSRSMVYSLMSRGELGSITVGSRRLVQVASVNRLISGESAPAAGEGRYEPRPRTAKVRPIRPQAAPAASAAPSVDVPPVVAPRRKPVGKAPTKRGALHAVPPPTEAAPVTVLTIDETVERLKCSKGRVRAMLRDGRLTPVNVGRRVFVSAPGVLAMVEAADGAE